MNVRACADTTIMAKALRLILKEWEPEQTGETASAHAAASGQQQHHDHVNLFFFFSVSVDV